MQLPTPLAQDEALRALSDIRAAIDRTTRYSTFSALSGVIAGSAAVAGSGLFGYFENWAGAQPLWGPHFLWVWSGVFGIAILSLFLLTWMKARKRGDPAWTPIAKTALSALVGPAAAGILGSAALISSGHYALLPGLWLTLYGCGLYVVSFFAPLFLRALGLAFMGLGFTAWLSGPEWAALWLGLGFGVLHLIFSVVVFARYRA